MLQMGGDFGFENANAWFKNLDKLIAAVNREGRVNVGAHSPWPRRSSNRGRGWFQVARCRARSARSSRASRGVRSQRVLGSAWVLQTRRR